MSPSDSPDPTFVLRPDLAPAFFLPSELSRELLRMSDVAQLAAF